MSADITLLCLCLHTREQILQRYLAQRHAVFILKDTLSVQDEKKC